MNSNWARETLASFQKEWLTEMRSRHGLFTSFLFSLLAVVAMALASFGRTPDSSIAAGMLCVTLLFSAVVALPRTFLVEDEQGTFDLVRMVAEPTALYTGKLVYNTVQFSVSTLVLSTMFVAFSGVKVTVPVLLVTGLIFTTFSLAGGVSACGALVIGASNRWLLGTASSLPILLPQVFLGMGAIRASFGTGSPAGGWMCVVGLMGWSLALYAAGPLIAAAAWNTER